ncbi:hypothetical protein EXIGLDRAFT_830544 [Exidia glandulosa HHB12029]|uniref:F-box domain-containing protein n=1 Tax=Exidia glandulosa HHB12029 TaxID=1314781 RepID=A0A165NEY1_EXIGL|nr:hypothetical protein EXIGLDRAFT_830544 [Exidia glandulosa HHB12029]
MVSVDNLPFDIIALILDYASPRTLVSSALVSTAFHSASMPLLYRSLTLNAHNSVRVELTFRSNPRLATFVRRCIVAQQIPVIVCNSVLRQCTDLQALSVADEQTVLSLLKMGVLAQLSSLRRMDLNLRAVVRWRGSDQDPAQLLEQSVFAPGRLAESVALRAPSAGVISRMLPWLEGTGKSLTELRLTDAYALELDFLSTLLALTPGLRVLHLNRTLGVEALSLTHLVPNLHELGITIHMGNRLPTRVDPLIHLTKLSYFLSGVDDIDALDHLWRSIANQLSSSPLSDIFLVADSDTGSQASARPLARRQTLPGSTVTALTGMHVRSIRHLQLSPSLAGDTLSVLFRTCPNLEYLSTFSLRASDAAVLGDAIALRCLVLSAASARITSTEVIAFAKVCPSLRLVVHVRRRWKVVRTLSDVHAELMSTA